jgi:hypothetical protein
MENAKSPFGVVVMDFPAAGPSSTVSVTPARGAKVGADVVTVPVIVVVVTTGTVGASLQATATENVSASKTRRCGFVIAPLTVSSSAQPIGRHRIAGERRWNP